MTSQADNLVRCSACGVGLHPSPKMDKKRPFYPCPGCGARVNFYTGEEVPLIDFLSGRHAVFAACADPERWAICDCLHLMTMIPEAPDKGELGTPSRLRSNVLLAVYRSAYWPLLRNYAAFRREKILMELDVEKLVNKPEGLERDDMTAIAYGSLRDIAIALYHGSKAA